MPQDGWFFTILRRFNLLVGALAGLAFLVFIAVQGFIWSVDSQSPGRALFSPVSPNSATKTVAYDVQLEPLETTAQADDGLYVLMRETPTRSEGRDGRAFEVANLMLIDSKTGSGKWLFRGTNRNIFSRFGVREGKRDPDATVDKRRIVGLVLWIAENRINQDGTLSGNNDVSAYYWRFDRPEAVKLLNADSEVATGQFGSGYNIVYKKGKKTISAIYSVPDFKLLSQTALPDPDK